jgi:arylsulfatase A-like enzyme
MKRSLLCLLFLLLVCGGQVRAVDVSTPAAPSKSAKPWNFVVILLDDAGWRDFGFTGNRYIETPNLDRLAERGMSFANAYATHPFCSPTRQSMITGQWPARTAWVQKSEIGDLKAARMAPEFCPAGTFQWTERRPEFVSLPEALRSKGYRTGHIGKWHFGIPNFDISPEREGFEVNFGGASAVGAASNFFAPFEGLPGKVSSEPGEYLTDRLTDETIQFIREHKDEPFYVQLWHYAPHEPLQAPEELVAKYREIMRIVLPSSATRPKTRENALASLFVTRTTSRRSAILGSRIWSSIPTFPSSANPTKKSCKTSSET